jgi:hypothetical protein
MHNSKSFDDPQLSDTQPGKTVPHPPWALLSEVALLDLSDLRIDLTLAEVQRDLDYGRAP